MDKEKFLRGVGEVDDSLIEDFCKKDEDLQKKKKSRSALLRITAIAASLAILVAAALVSVPYIRGGGEHSDGQLSEDVKPIGDSNEIIKSLLGEPKIESGEMALVSSQLCYITDGEYSSYRAGRVIEESFVGNKIGDVSVKSFIRYHLENRDADFEEYDAEIFEISGADRSAAICLKYTKKNDRYSNTMFYAFVNPKIEANSKGELYAKLGADSLLTLSNSASISAKDMSDYYRGEYYSFDDGKLEELRKALLEADGERVLLDEAAIRELIRSSKSIAKLYVSCPSANMFHSTVAVLESGYVLQVIAEEVYLFNVGESAGAIVDFINENGIPHSQKDDEVVVYYTTQVE